MSGAAARGHRAPGAPPLPGTPLRFVAHALRGFGLAYGAMLALEALAAASGIMAPYALAQIIRGVTRSQEASQSVVDSLSGPLSLFFGLAVAEVVFGRLAGAVQVRMGPRLRQGVVRQLFHYLQLHSHRYVSSHFAGGLAHRISETAMGTLQILWIAATEFWPTLIAMTVATALLFQAHRQLGLLVLLWALAYVACSFALARRCQPHAKRASGARSHTTGTIVDSVTNLFSARVFARLGLERQLLDGVLAKEFRAIRTSSDFAERIRWFQFSAAALLKVGVLYAALRLWGQGDIAVSEFVMAVSLALLLINESRNLARRFLDLFDHAGNVAHGIQTLVCPHEVTDRPDARHHAIREGHIRFDAVRFGYGAQDDVFDGLSVDIPAGQRVGLVGHSGSGKSTFVSLLLRLYDVRGGCISIDGVPLPAMTQASLHEQVALIPQDPSLFHRSLRENIRYGQPDATDDEVVAAARRAHAHDFIAQTPEGYDAMVGERGVKLSGGQRQRIAIARVILKNAPVLILDEATSALDSITETAIQETLAETMQGRTAIVVAHRLSTIAHLDRILVFERGRIVEDGTHAELLARRGAYWQLWCRQAGGFLAGEPDGPARTAPAEAADAASPQDPGPAPVSPSLGDDEALPLPRAAP